MRLIDATDLVRRVLEERDKIMSAIPNFEYAAANPERYRQAMHGGLRKALRCIEESPTIDAVPVIRCKDCVYWKPRHIKLNDGSERAYLPGEDYVGITVGINVGSQCMVDEYSGYGCDKSVFRSENDFCSRGERKMDAEVEDETATDKK